MTQWTYHNPVRIHFGRGCRKVLVDVLSDARCLVVTTQRGRRQFSDDPVLGRLADRNDITWLDSVTPNPGISELQNDIDRLRGSAFDAIIGFGGGSALDSAKVLAVALSGDLKGYSLQDLLNNLSLHETVRPIRLHAVPTTAGTGSEVTPFSTVWDHAIRRKYSLAGSAAFPATAVVDPALTDRVPAEVTLSTGLDAINQASESIWNRNATPVTIGFATRALQLGFEALPRLVDGEGSEQDRDRMAETSLLAGLAISQTRTALCHSMSYPITAHFGVPHGLACAFTMSAVYRCNLEADDGRLTTLATALGYTNANALGEGIETLLARFGVHQRVREQIGDWPQLQALAGDMYTPGRADNNLAPVDAGLIERVLRASWETGASR